MNHLLQAKVAITKGKTLTQTARRMVFGAQDHNKIVDLHHLVILISVATTPNINNRDVLIDELWGLVRDLWRLVGRGHELHGRIIEGSLWRCIELGDHLPRCLPKE